jgi:lambda family phage portal protein
MNALDRAIAYISPTIGVRRAQHRRVLAYYEAASPNRLRKGRRAPGTGNLVVHQAGRNLREQARYFEQNHDLARGVLTDLVAKTIGPYGIMCEPQPQMLSGNGEINDLFAWEILRLWKDWGKRPEVTWQHDWASAQRIAARSWFRDGEVFTQMIQGTTPFLDHGTKVPMSLELIEADLVPFEYSLPPTIVMGIEVNTWGRPVAYWVLKMPPGDVFQGFAIVPTNLKRMTADRMLHVAARDRIRQFRGVSVFATVLGRLDDLKDYEESERIAAKVAASMAAMIKKGAPEDYVIPDATGSDKEHRDLKFRPGMIFDDLLPGETIETIDTKRPNPNLLTYRQGQLRGVGSGTGTSYSSIAKDYNGTYSAQRQELVESWSAYATLAAEFTSRFVCPVYEAFIATAIASGQLKVPKGIDPDTIDDAIYIAPQMPWIDPEKEAASWVLLESAGFASAPEIIRRRGANPNDVLIQESRWRKLAEKLNLSFVTLQPRIPGATPSTTPAEPAQPAVTPTKGKG